MLQQLLAVFLVLALLLTALWLLRRGRLPAFSLLSKQSGHSRQITVIERVALTPQHSLHLVKIVDTMLVVGVSPAGFHSLASLPEPSKGAEQTMPRAAGIPS